MEPLLIRGVPVQFPFEPYDIQRVYMEKVIACLQDGVNGILESPTGTGKTLCLLCATLAWAESVKAELSATVQDLAQNSNELFSSLSSELRRAAGAGWLAGQSSAFTPTPPRVIFASRTHTQLSQVVQELKRTAYRHVRCVVLASRDQLCTHPEVSREANNTIKLHMCQSRVKARSCMLYNNVESKRNDSKVLDSRVVDIEDLVGLGKSLSFCPYYMARSLREGADIVFMPYNYLLDPKTRKANGIELHNSVVILDEAHNIEKTCEDSASLQLRSTDIALCVDELTHVLTQMVSAEAVAESAELGSQAVSTAAAELNAENIMLLKAMLLELEKAIDSIEIVNVADGIHFPGSFMFELLEKAQIVHSKRAVIAEELDRVISYLTNTATSVFSRRGNGLQKFADLIKVVFSRDNFNTTYMERVKKCYKVHIGFDSTKPKKRPLNDPWQSAAAQSSPQGRVVSYWCFSSGFGMSELMEQGVKSVILTSGTLSPLDAFVSELQISMPVRLENPHIINSDQVCVACVPRGPDGVHLSSSYANRSNQQYVHSLGQTVANISRLVPDGLLVFFPSYGMLKSCTDAWQMSGVWGRIAANKTVLTETGTKEEFSQSIQDYYRYIDEPASGTRGACFMAVCRGKVSEGLDFANCNGRAVIITGLPYPPLKDPRVVLKRQYLDETRSSTGSLSGQDWYTLEASRAINQAIGRVIRHGRDYGAILLCDSRLGDVGFSRQLSAWLRPHVRKYDKFGLLVRDLTTFYRSCSEKYPCASAGKGSGKRSNGSGPGFASFPLDVSRPVGSVQAMNSAGSHQSHPVNISSMYKTDNLPKQNKREQSLFEQEAHWHDNHGLDENSKGRTDCGISVRSDHLPQLSVSCTASSVKRVSPPSKPNSRLKLKHNPASRVLQSGRGTSTASTLVPSGGSSTPFDRTAVSASSVEQSVASSDGRNAQQRRVAEYIIKAKQVLTKQEYASFSQTIKDYNREKNFDRMISALSSVLIVNDNAEYSSLMTDFVCFVRPDHRQKFSQICSSLIGR